MDYRAKGTASRQALEKLRDLGLSALERASGPENKWPTEDRFWEIDQVAKEIRFAREFGGVFTANSREFNELTEILFWEG